MIGRTPEYRGKKIQTKEVKPARLRTLVMLLIVLVFTAGESGATNLGPRSKALLEDTKALVAHWHALGFDPTPDLVTISASGLDPDITPEDAMVQVPMVANATGSRHSGCAG